MENVMSKTIIIYRVIEMISKKYNIRLEEARKRFYSSRVIDLLDEDETGLYGESPLYVFSLYEEEEKRKI